MAHYNTILHSLSKFLPISMFRKEAKFAHPNHVRSFLMLLYIICALLIIRNAYWIQRNKVFIAENNLTESKLTKNNQIVAKQMLTALFKLAH